VVPLRRSGRYHEILAVFRLPTPMTRPTAFAAGLALAVAAGTFAVPAHAYLDPSTGSMILSAIVGIFATVSLALKTYWYKLKALFRRSPPGATGPAGPAAGADGPSAPGSQR
jgi:hypothetical protein